MFTVDLPEIGDGRSERLARRLEGHRRILLFGEMGCGKSTLALALLRALHESRGAGQILELDPGTPPFGVPGALSRAWIGDDGLCWRIGPALCTLNAGRFRLPLILAAARLLAATEAARSGPLIIDPPGVVRGVGGAELLAGLMASLAVDAVVILHPADKPPPLAEELKALPAAIYRFAPAPEARPPARLDRLRQRRALWERFLAGAVDRTIFFEQVQVVGTPPPRAVPTAWAGRQAALLDGAGDLVGLGEVVTLAGETLSLRLVELGRTPPVVLLIRDAGRSAEGGLETRTHGTGRMVVEVTVPEEMTPPVLPELRGCAPVSSHLGPVWATLVGGAFGDPLLHVRVRHRRRSFLFDLGNPGRLSAKVAHQVQAVFLSHAHIDHIGGLIWFIRSRIGPFGPCRIVGPPETIDRVAGFLGGITWDRIGDRGPIFEVSEYDGERLRCALLQPGRPATVLPERAVTDGTIFEEDDYLVRAVVCDHNIPSVAYAFILKQEINIRKERLAASDLAPGPWLARLKRSIAAGRLDDEIELPGGRRGRVGELAQALTIIRPGKKLVYAADMADTPANREKVVGLARSAHTLFCECAFIGADRQKAAATQHLTTTAAARLAREAGVENLVPFHLSKRYERRPGAVYAELREAAGPVRVLGHF